MTLNNEENGCNESHHEIVETEHISLIGLNVCGIIGKLKFDPFIEQILVEHNIICLSETKTDVIDEILLKDFAQKYE